MYLKKEKAGLWKWTGLFFALMLVFTLLSRAVYQSGVIVVTTAQPGNGSISHEVRISGKTVQNQELAVTTTPGLRIAQVLVNEGQQVKQGEVLFTLDMEYLKETIRYQEQELEKQKLSIQDAWSQSNASQQLRNNAKAQAEENYNAAVSQAQTALERAQRDLEQAKAALEGFQNGQSAEQAEQMRLTEVCRQAREQYDAALLALEQLKQELEGKNQAASAQLLEPAVYSGDTVPQSPTEQPPPAPQEDGSRLAEAEARVQEAKNTLEEAQAALDAFQKAQENGQPSSEQALKAAVDQAQERYDDALAALESAKTTYGRAIHTAGLSSGTNHAAQIGEITYAQMEDALDELKILEEAQGRILAPVDGVVTARFVQTGEKTTDSTAVLLADLTQGFRFSGLVSEEQSPYIGVGDPVVIRSGSTGKLYKDLPVTTCSATEEPGGGYRLTVQLPPGTLALGASAQLQFTKRSQPYACCVPLSALRLDDRNKPYVLTVEAVDTVLGKQLQAKKVSVTVLDQNETMAALAEGAVSNRQEIILGSDKALEPGSRIRVG